jgi:hypothetical protein
LNAIKIEPIDVFWIVISMKNGQQLGEEVDQLFQILVIASRIIELIEVESQVVSGTAVDRTALFVENSKLFNWGLHPRAAYA